MNFISIESERNARIAQTKDEEPPSTDGTIFIAKDNGDMSMNKTLIEMTETYPTLDCWNSMKIAIDNSDPGLFTQDDAITLIHNANKLFPNQNLQFTYTLLSVVSHCVSEMIENPFELLLKDKQFLNFFSKLIICFNIDFDRRCLLASIDIVGRLADFCNIQMNDQQILEVFFQIQNNIIGLIGLNTFNEYIVHQMLFLLDKMIKFTPENRNAALLTLFANYITPNISSEDIQSQSIKASYHIFKRFPNLYNSIIGSADYLNNLIFLLSKEFASSKYAAKILLPLLSNPNTCQIILDLNVAPVLFQSFVNSIKTNNTNSINYIDDITAICETSQAGCTLFMQNNFLNQPQLLNVPYKITIFLLRIIHAALSFNILPVNESMIPLLTKVIEEALESEDEDILVKTMKIMFALRQKGINFVDKMRETLQQLSLNEYSENVANAATALIQAKT